MKKVRQNNSCSVCGNTSQDITGNQHACNSCCDLAEQLRGDHDKLASFCKLLGIPQHALQHDGHSEKELPDVLDAVRYRTNDRERNTWYVSVSELEGNPVEVFASTAFDRDQHLQSRISNLTTITRLISLILRNIYLGEKLTLDKTLTQLRRSSRQSNDLPDMLSDVLANYRREDETVSEGQKKKTQAAM